MVREKFPLVARTAAMTGLSINRNTATMAGKLCHALSFADTAPLLLCQGAKVRIEGATGHRIMPLKDFFVQAERSALQSDEILAEILVPPLPANSSGVYLKNPGPAAADMSMAGVAAVISMEADKSHVADVKIVPAAPASLPLRAYEAENTLRGMAINEELIAAAALAASREAKPQSLPADQRELARILTSRAIKQALQALGE